MNKNAIINTYLINLKCSFKSVLCVDICSTEMSDNVIILRELRPKKTIADCTAREYVFGINYYLKLKIAASPYF